MRGSHICRCYVANSHLHEVRFPRLHERLFALHPFRRRADVPRDNVVLCSVPGRPGWHLKSSHRVRRYVQIRPKAFPLYGVNRGPPHHPCFCSITRNLNTPDGKHELPLCSCSGRRRRNYRFGRVGPLLELAYISENPREKDRDKLGEDDVSFRTRSTYPIWLERCATAVNRVT